MPIQSLCQFESHGCNKGKYCAVSAVPTMSTVALFHLLLSYTAILASSNSIFYEPLVLLLEVIELPIVFHNSGSSIAAALGLATCAMVGVCRLPCSGHPHLKLLWRAS